MKNRTMRLTNGSLIALIVAISLSWATMPTIGRSQTVAGTVPGNDKAPEPYVVISDFETGTNVITEVQVQELEKLRRHLVNNPTYATVLIGTVSDKPIRGGCYFDPNDPTYFATPGKRNRFPNANAQFLKGQDSHETNAVCQTKLSLARAFAARNWLVNNGIEPGRIYIFNYATQGLIPGSNYPNQSVLAWIIATNGDKVTINPDDNEMLITAPNICPEPQIVVDPPCCKAVTTNEKTVNGTKILEISVDCSACADSDQPKTQQCHWYYQWPCMSDEEKIIWGVLTVAAIVGGALLASSIKSEAETSNTKACTGPGC